MTAPLLSPAALSRMRAIQRANMPSACALVVLARTRGAAGTSPSTPVVVATVPCRLSSPSASLPLVADQPTPAGEYLLTLPAEVELEGVARAIVSGTTSGGIAYTVQLKLSAPEEPRSYEASRRLRATLASDAEAVVPVPMIGSVIVEEAP